MCCTAYLNNVGKRHEEGGDLMNRLWRTSRQTTQGRRRGGGANAQGETREGAGRCGDQQEDVRRDQEQQEPGTMWKTASASPPHREDDPG